MVEQFRVGVITAPHGLKGDVKVFPTTDDPLRFRKLKTVTLDLGSEKKVLKVRKASFFKQFVILGFEGLDRIEDVERLRGKDLLVDREDAIALPEGRYFIADLIGLRVIDENDEEIGILKEVLETGANDVYVAQRPDGRELLLPVIDECVLETDPEAGFVRIHMMPGLEDL
ncbi:MAG: ribosome maturation factor RimM [Lachnospiraceae bacterium]|nr:ribosome maturation factor RimM [Lachnospiraceae bacterium]